MARHWLLLLYSFIVSTYCASLIVVMRLRARVVLRLLLLLLICHGWHVHIVLHRLLSFVAGTGYASLGSVIVIGFAMVSTDCASFIG